MHKSLKDLTLTSSKQICPTISLLMELNLEELCEVVEIVFC